jgi:hypothetical protein
MGETEEEKRALWLIQCQFGYNADQARKYLKLVREREKEIQESREKARFEMENSEMSREIYERKMALIDKIEEDWKIEDEQFQEKTDKINERINQLLSDETVKNFTVTFSKNDDGSIDAGFFVLADKSKHSKQHMMRKVSRSRAEEKAEN